jgi:hypothetical protein
MEPKDGSGGDAVIITFDPSHVTDAGPYCNPLSRPPTGVFYVGWLFGDDVVEAFFEYGDFPQVVPTPAMDEVK